MRFPKFPKVRELAFRVSEADLEPARYINMGLASWLLVSAYLWPHSEPQFLLTILVGAIVAIVAPFELGPPLARKINMGAAGLLALAAFALPHTAAATRWHNLILALAIGGVSYFGPPHGKVPIRPEAPLESYEATGGV